MDYLLHLLVFVLLFGMVALSLNVASGLTQLISLAQAGFFGVGRREYAGAEAEGDAEEVKC